MSRLRARRRRTQAVGVFSAFALVAAPVLVWTSAAAADTNYNALSSAYGFDMTFTNPSFPAGIVLQGAGPFAQSHQTSLGESDAQAAFPYPGDTAVGGPGLVSALLGVPVPAYPFYASTSAGQDPQQLDFGGVQISVESGGTVTRASSTVGGTSSGYDAISQIVALADGTVRSTAEATMKAIRLGDAVSMSNVRSTAEAVSDLDGSVHVTSSLVIGQLTAPGASLVLPKTTPTAFPSLPVNGFPETPAFPAIPVPMGGQTIESPQFGFEADHFTIRLPVMGGQSFPIAPGPVIEAFKQIGVVLHYQQAQPIGKTGVVAPALTMDTVLPSPPPNEGFSGATPVSMTVGRSTVDIPLSSVASTGGIGVGGFGSVPAGTTGSTTQAGVPSGVDAAGLAPILPGTVPSAAVPPGDVQLAQPVANPGAPREPADRDLQLVYLMVVVGAAVLLVSQVLRAGVRFR